MKKLMILAIATLVATSAYAQGDPGDMGVFFDSGGNTTTACWPAFTQTNHFYVVTFDLPGGLAGYEVGLTIDPTIIIFNSAMVAGAGPINVGSAPDNWIVGTGSCVNGAGAVVLLDLTAGYFVSPVADLTICTHATSPSSFAPAAPGWLLCNDELRPFGVAESGAPAYPDGCGVVCPSAEAPVASGTSSWGALKAVY